MLTRGAMENIKLGAGGSYSLSRDAISHRIWDSRPFGTTISDHTYFAQPVGAPWIVNNKTTNETNVYDSGKLPNGQTFLINKFAVACRFLSAATPDAATASAMTAYQAIIENSVFEITLQGRAFDFQLHGRQLLATPLAATYAVANTGRLGDMITSGWVRLDPTPIFLDQLVSFAVKQTVSNPVPGLVTILNAASTYLNGYYANMMVILDGFLTRAK